MRILGRKVRLTATGASGLVINAGQDTDRELKIAFSAARSLSSSANDGTIRIWNLSEGHRNAMGRELEDVRLEAGYINETGEDVGVIFAGQIRKPSHAREGADIITTLECGDGDRGLRRAAVSKAFPAGTPVRDVIEHVAEAFEPHGVVIGEMKLPDLGKLRRPYAMCGSARREMDRLCRSVGAYWSVQSGTLETVPGDGWLKGIASFDAGSGLIGVPSKTDVGVEAEVFLSPGLRPGRTVRIASELMELGADDKLFRVSKVNFDGDNRVGQFVAGIGGEAIRGGKVDEGALR